MPAILLAVSYSPFKSVLSRFLRAESVVEAANELAAHAKSQQAPIQVRTALVQVDAMVTDKSGNRIEHLSVGNFQLSEDDQRQKLAAVDYFDVGKTQISPDAEPIFISLSDQNASQTLQMIGRDHRLIVLFFDKTTMYPDDLLRAVHAAQDFVKNEMTPADLIAVATYAMDLTVTAGFTNDRPTLDAALDSLIPGKAQQAGDQKSKLNTAVNKDSGTFEVEHSLLATTALTEMLGQIPGRKSVIHFTGGLILTGRGGMNNLPALDAATNAANDDNASLYEIDARGLVTICYDAVAPPAGRRGEAADASGPPQLNGDLPCACIYVHIPGRQCQPVTASRNTLYTMAAETGGAMFTDMNDLRPMFKQVLDESTGYYLLSYESSNAKHDGTYRHISVKLVGVPGGQVKYRPGYVAPKDKK